MNSKAFWLIIIAVILLSAVFLWFNHTSTQETLIKAQETIEETKQALRESQEAFKKIDKIAQEMKDVSQIAEKAGDDYVKEIKFVSDDEFLNKLNDYSSIVVERVKQLE